MMKRIFPLVILVFVITAAGLTLAQRTRPPARKTVSSGYIGQWLSTDESETVVISTNDNSIAASFAYKGADRSMIGKWTDCKVSGNKLKCKWNGDHDDATKTAKRKGTLKATLKGDALSVIYYEEDTEDMNWKPGYGPHIFDGSIGAGAIHEQNYKRKVETTRAGQSRDAPNGASL
jgi:hypothetical protein